MNCKLQKIWFS